MQRYLLYIANQIKAIWQHLDLAQRVTILLLSLILIVGLVALATWGSRPDFQILYANLEQQDAAKIVTKLSESNIPYQLESGGSVISVPSKHVHETRLMMATEGLPSRSGVGFEIFDDFKFGITDFTQKLNFQRALQTELAHTIAQISTVQQARVHIAFPDEELYSDYQQKTTASVILDLGGGIGLTRSQINGVVHLVASAVKGLNPQNITIVDSAGNMLFHQEENEEGFGQYAGTSSQLEEQKRFEQDIENRIQSMLFKVLGPNKSVVRVSAELDFDLERIESEIYEPSESPIQRSNKLVEETFSGEGEGAQSPIGTAPPAGQQSNYSKIEETNNYEITKHIKQTVKATGAIKRLSLAVILDREVPEEELESIREAATAAVGINAARGDSLVVKAMTFDKSILENAKAEMQKAQKFIWLGQGAKIGGILLGLFALYLFVRSTLKKIAKSELPGISLELSGAGPQPSSFQSGETGNLDDRLKQLATQQTDEFIDRLRNWLTE